MAARSPNRLRRDSSGFTLIELLVVILIIGVLAAIALPVFLGQQRKSQDADAKSGARNLLTLVEACNLEEQDLRMCDQADELKVKGLTLGADPGEVEVTDASRETAIVRAHSRSGNEFRIVRDADGNVTRTCDSAGHGACREGSLW